MLVNGPSLLIFRPSDGPAFKTQRLIAALQEFGMVWNQTVIFVKLLILDIPNGCLDAYEVKVNIPYFLI